MCGWNVVEMDTAYPKAMGHWRWQRASCHFVKCKGYSEATWTAEKSNTDEGVKDPQWKQEPAKLNVNFQLNYEHNKLRNNSTRMRLGTSSL
jgi:hypothetical protein